MVNINTATPSVLCCYGKLSSCKRYLENRCPH